MPFETPADLSATVYASADAISDTAELRVGGAAWLALSSSQKDAIAAVVTQTFDSLDFCGEAASTTQLLEWPRTGTDYSTTSWPVRLVNAAKEYAIILAASVGSGTDPLNSLSSTSGNIKREKVGPLETEYFAATSAATDAFSLEVFPAIVHRLLSPLVCSTITTAWGSGIAVRGS